jgi:hypothetical protein
MSNRIMLSLIILVLFLSFPSFSMPIKAQVVWDTQSLASGIEIRLQKNDSTLVKTFTNMAGKFTIRHEVGDGQGYKLLFYTAEELLLIIDLYTLPTPGLISSKVILSSQ